MNFRIPWIISRRSKIFNISIDYTINIFIYNYIFFKELEITPSSLVSNSLAFFWIVISYILGRYEKNRNSIISSFSKALIKIILIFLLCNSIYFFVNLDLPIVFFKHLDTFNDYISRELNNLFLRSSLYISISSLFIQYFLGIISNNIHNKKEQWIFLGRDYKYKQIIQEIAKDKSNIKLSIFSNQDNLDRLNIEDIKGLVIGNLNDINEKNLDILFNMKLKGVLIESLLTWFENRFHRIPTQIIENKYQLIEKIKSIEDNYQLRAKRLGDLIVSLTLLVITSPLLFVTAFLIFIEDSGPIFYSQTRTGLNGEVIKIFKFRSMKMNAEKNGIQWAKHSDPRITRIGKFIRAARIDELPQLICVIKGDMSLIGPRPERPEIENNSLKDIPYYNCRTLLKPGISGWAQVNYPYGASIYDSTKKLSFDIYYISHFSILLDLLILFKTIKLVLNAKGSKPQI